MRSSSEIIRTYVLVHDHRIFTLDVFEDICLLLHGVVDVLRVWRPENIVLFCFMGGGGEGKTF